MPVKKRGNSYQVSVTHNGQKYRRSSSRWTKQQALEVERKLLEDLHAIDMGRQPDRMFYDAVKRWKAEVLPRQKPRTQQESLLNMGHIAPYLENRRLTEAKEVASEIRKAFMHLSTATVNRRLSLVRQMVNLAYRDWGWLETPVLIRLEKEPPPREVFLTEEQVERMAHAAPRLGPYILLAAYTGIRRAHLLRLTAQDVVGDCIRLDRGGKTSAAQLIPLHPRVQEIAKGLPYPMSPRIFFLEFEKAKKAIGVKCRFHDLRHTAASWLIQSGADLRVVQMLLGHYSVQVTQRYAHLNVTHLRSAVRKIGTHTGHIEGERAEVIRLRK